MIPVSPNESHINDFLNLLDELPPEEIRGLAIAFIRTKAQLQMLKQLFGTDSTLNEGLRTWMDRAFKFPDEEIKNMNAALQKLIKVTNGRPFSWKIV